MQAHPDTARFLEHLRAALQARIASPLHCRQGVCVEPNGRLHQVPMGHERLNGRSPLFTAEEMLELSCKAAIEALQHMNAVPASQARALRAAG